MKGREFSFQYVLNSAPYTHRRGRECIYFLLGKDASNQFEIYIEVGSDS